MRKAFKKLSIYLLIVISAMFINVLNVFALDDVNQDNVDVNTTTESSLYDSYDYVIDKYDVNIIVNENNTFDITETITVDFNTLKHGINRFIPLINKIYRKNGIVTTNRAQIDDLTVNHEFNTYVENGNYIIQIGSSDKTMKGKETYVIKYTYNIGKDPIKGYDEVYFDIIGDKWDTVINNVTFKIFMPKKFDSRKLEFLLNDELLNNKAMGYIINDNTIIGSYNGVLKNDSLRISLELPEGYFVNAKINNDINTYLMFIIPISALIVAFIIWYLFVRNKKVIESVDFYPPEDYNSLEVGFLYKGYADNKDVTSLLIYLANKGYLKIEDFEEKAMFFKKKGFKITKLKDYDGNNLYERMFFNGLFGRITREGFVTVNEVTSSELYHSFYNIINSILGKINTKENKRKISKNNVLYKILLVILLCVSYLGTLVLPVIPFTNSYSIIYTLVIYSFVLPFFILFIIYWKSIPGVLTMTIFMSAIAYMQIESEGIITAINLVAADPIYLLNIIVGIACLCLIILLFRANKRTDLGNKMLYKIKGFKNYLQTVEKERLEDNVKKDPEYFYNILPYTYVLGVSKKWMKKFEIISVSESSNNFNYISDFKTYDHTFRIAQRVMTSSDSSSSSSGDSSSGGGSSSGGSGGGGGSSW